MSTPFQPSDSHAPAMKPGLPILMLISIVCALGMVMIVSVVIPRIALEEGVHWGVTLGVGIATFILVMVYGLSRRRQEASEKS